MLDGGFVEALGTLKLTPAPVGDGKITKAGVARFPITGGNVTYYKPGTVSPYVQGEIDHDGSGLSLTGGGKTVELTDFVVDPGASVLTGKVTVDGKVAAESAPLFFLDGRTLQPLKAEGSTAVLEGTTVKLKDEAAHAAQRHVRHGRARRRPGHRRGEDHRQRRLGGLDTHAGPKGPLRRARSRSRPSGPWKRRRPAACGPRDGRSRIRTWDLFLIREAL